VSVTTKVTPAQAAAIAAQKLATKPTKSQPVAEAKVTLTELVIDDPMSALAAKLSDAAQAARLDQMAQAHQRELAEVRAEVVKLEGLLARMGQERKLAVDQRSAAEERQFPLVARCDTSGCESMIAFRPAIEDEAAIVMVLHAARWTTPGSRHLCPGCSRNRS
jgi:hypothetical protein